MGCICLCHIFKTKKRVGVGQIILTLAFPSRTEWRLCWEYLTSVNKAGGGTKNGGTEPAFLFLTGITRLVRFNFLLRTRKADKRRLKTRQKKETTGICNSCRWLQSQYLDYKLNESGRQSSFVSDNECLNNTFSTDARCFVIVFRYYLKQRIQNINRCSFSCSL